MQSKVAILRGRGQRSAGGPSPLWEFAGWPPCPGTTRRLGSSQGAPASASPLIPRTNIRSHVRHVTHAHLTLLILMRA